MPWAINLLGFQPVFADMQLARLLITPPSKHCVTAAVMSNDGAKTARWHSKILSSNRRYEQRWDEALQDNTPRHYPSADVTSKDGAKSYKKTLRNVAHPLTLRAMEERSLIRWHSKTLCTSKRFRAKTGRSPKRNIAHGNTMGKR